VNGEVIIGTILGVPIIRGKGPMLLLKDFPEPPNDFCCVRIYEHRWCPDTDRIVVDMERSWWGSIGDADMCEPGCGYDDETTHTGEKEGA